MKQYIICTYWLSGRAGRKKKLALGQDVRVHVGPIAASFVGYGSEPNIFPSGPRDLSQ